MKRKNAFSKKDGIKLFLMALPFLALVILFSYVPLYGWIYAFYDYSPGVPLAMTEFVGMQNFTRMFRDQYAIREVLRVIGNTVGMKLIGYLFSPLPMIFAMCLNDVRGRHFRKTVQTITTIPNFISWVLVYAVAYAMFSIDDGFVNKALVSLGILENGYGFLTGTSAVWLKMVLWGVWKGTGWSSILYFAAISGIDQELYEAARIDGAGRFQIMRYITLPHLLPTFFVLLILSIADFFNTGFEQYLLFGNAFIYRQVETLDLYIYIQSFTYNNYSYSTAIGIIKSIIGLVLLFSANSLSKKIRGFGIM